MQVVAQASFVPPMIKFIANAPENDNKEEGEWKEIQKNEERKYEKCLKYLIV